jgi:hypothetical protein
MKEKSKDVFRKCAYNQKFVAVISNVKIQTYLRLL